LNFLIKKLIFYSFNINLNLLLIILNKIIIEYESKLNKKKKKSNKIRLNFIQSVINCLFYILFMILNNIYVIILPLIYLIRE
jgi:hypothetical protein